MIIGLSQRNEDKYIFLRRYIVLSRFATRNAELSRRVLRCEGARWYSPRLMHRSWNLICSFGVAGLSEVLHVPRYRFKGEPTFVLLGVSLERS